MFNDLFKFGLTQDFSGKQSPDQKINGVTVGSVIDNVDFTGEARVKLRLPWLPGVEPWARLCVLMGGMGRGTYFVPQIGDEVLVAFHHGDVREPYVLGTLWNTLDRPPALFPDDPITKRCIRTPLGHELTFDDKLQTVTLSSNFLSTVTLTADKAEISTPTARVTIGKLGEVTIKAATVLNLEAPVIKLKADALLSAKSSGVAEFGATGACAVKGAPLAMN